MYQRLLMAQNRFQFVRDRYSIVINLIIRLSRSDDLNDPSAGKTCLSRSLLCEDVI